MRGKRPSAGPQDARLLAALREEGCPICHVIAGSDDHYFFWFFNENYYETFSLDRLTRSLGFCLAHGARLTRSAVGASQLAAVHEVLVRRIRAILCGPSTERHRGEVPGSALVAYDLCPACQDSEDQVARTAFWLAALLEEPGGADRYARPGILCFPHLGAVVPRVTQNTFERLLAAHESALTSTVASLEELRAELGRIPSEGRQDPVKTLLPSLRLGVGHDRGNGAYPGAEESGGSWRRRDPVGDFLEAIRRADGCPVCLEAGRAWIEWLTWLVDAVPRDSAVEDLLPTCPEHVWATVHLGGAFLALATVRHVVGAIRGVVGRAIQILTPSPPPEPERWSERIKRRLQEPRHRFRAAREMVARALECPVCRRLAVARDRTLALLFALLEDRQHRVLFEDGYGLCLKHVSRALALRPAPSIRAVLVEVEAAKLARLHWELEEQMRKAAWNVRPESKGAEGGAWQRAVLRFSGSLGQKAG